MANGNVTNLPAGQTPPPGPGSGKKIDWKKIGWLIVGLLVVSAALMYDQYFRNRDEVAPPPTVTATVNSEQPMASEADEEGEELEQQLNAFPGPCGNCK